MKNSKILMALAFVACLGLSSSPSAAAVVNFNGNFVNMSPAPLEIGQTGTITSSGGFGNAVLSFISGSLPSNSIATFTYNFVGNLNTSFLTSNAAYSYTDVGVNYKGFTTSSSPVGFDFAVGYQNNTPSVPLAIASSQITGSQSATVVIKNFSAGVLSYANAFLGTVTGSKNFTVAYNISAVPVPAALPLFGLGLGALGFVRARARKKAHKLMV
jgi:hypothetical protein